MDAGADDVKPMEEEGCVTGFKVSTAVEVRAQFFLKRISTGPVAACVQCPHLQRVATQQEFPAVNRNAG